MKNKQGFIHIICLILGLLNRDDWKQLIPLLCIMFISAILSAIGIAMVVPFVAVASNFSLIHTSTSLSWLYHFFHFSSDYRFLFFLGIIAFSLLLLGNALNVLLTWFSAKVTYALKYRWSNLFFSSYLAQPYPFFLTHRTAELSRNLLRELSSLTTVVLVLLDFLSKSLSIVAILAALLIANPFSTLFIVLGVGLIYVLIFFAIRNLLKKTSYYTNLSGQQTFKIVEEVFNAIKEVKLYHKELDFIDAFKKPTYKEQRYQALFQGLTPSPRYLLEIFAFGGVILLVLYLLLTHNNLSSFLPILGFLVVALYRLMPLIQNLFGEFSAILASESVVKTVSRDYHQLNIKMMQKEVLDRFAVAKDIGLFQKFEFQGVDFQYANTDRLAVANLNLTIFVGKMIGFVGPSGAGKTTVIDILLGLLKPQHGRLIVNDIVLDTEAKTRGWQTLLGYVPQAIVLSNSSIAQNIAFGELPETIDMERVKKAANFAQLSDFIHTLPEQYETQVGDRGIRLSGGQRQRIGIARALYRDPQVLILDEATNALDGLTEMEIMQNIHQLAREKTIIIIAHRLQTVMSCDRLYYVDQGSLVAEGSYAELAQSHPAFKRMVEAAEGNFYKKDSDNEKNLSKGKI